MLTVSFLKGLVCWFWQLLFFLRRSEMLFLSGFLEGVKIEAHVVIKHSKIPQRYGLVFCRF